MRYIFCAVMGLVFGSFANVYFYRIPLNLSVYKPGSFCPGCKTPIRWRDNIPVLSYILLKGKCRACNYFIHWQYPLVETLCSIIFLLVAIKFRHDSIYSLSAFLFFSFLVFLAAGTDLVTYFQNDRQYGIIPDHLVYILAAAGIIFSFSNPLFGDKFWRGFIGCAAGAGFLFFARWLGKIIFKREALGLGDVKIISVIGLWLGWQGVAITLTAGSAVGSIIGILAMRKFERNTPIPFGPFLALGSLSALFWL